MELIREKGYEIRGLKPPLEPPAPPSLLPIESPAAISWQGSTGAASYDVLRADRRTDPGPRSPKTYPMPTFNTGRSSTTIRPLSAEPTITA